MDEKIFYEEVSKQVEFKKQFPPGKVIFLNGTSSSGKTSIAKALQEELAEPFLHYPLDLFSDALPKKYIKNQILLALEVPKLADAFHKSLKSLVLSGNNIIIDHVLQEKEWLLDCLNTLKGHDVLFVGVKCDLNMLRERENKRKDRARGLAEYQFVRVHKDCIYDLEIDTSTISLEESVKKIKNAFYSNEKLVGFEKTYEKLVEQ